MWAGKPRPITPTYAKLCHARDVPDMDAFSRIHFREDKHRIFNGPDHTPTIFLTKGTHRDWLGRPVHPPIQQVSYAWWNFDDDTDFMIAQEAGTNEFQTLFPLNIRKKGRNPFTPPNGKVVTTGVQGPAWTEPMMQIMESTLLGPAAGTDEVGRRLVAYQMQMPMKGKGRNKEVNNSMITEVSETLEIVYKGMHTLLDFQKEPTPIDITITLTWVRNKPSSGVYERYRHQPYLRVTVSFDSKGKFGIIPIPESTLWRKAYQKLLRYQLGCPACLEFGMDRDPAQYLTTFMRRAEVLVQSPLSTPLMTELQRHSFLLDQLLGRIENATNQPLGFPISWIIDSRTLRTLQATARAGLPTANPHPAEVARLPAAKTTASKGYIDWAARRAETAPERLEDNPLGRHILDTYRRQIPQEEIDRQAAASSLLDAPTNESNGDELKDLEIDINQLDQQRSEHQRLQAEAHTEPAATKVKSNEDEDKKMPAKEARSNTKKPVAKKETEIDEDKKMPASSQRPSTDTPRATVTAATSDVLPSLENLTAEDEELILDHIIPWLRDNDIALHDNGIFYSESTTPPLVQQWLIRRGAVPATTPPAVAAYATPPTDATDDEIAAKKAKSNAKKPAAKKAEENDEDKTMPARSPSQRPSKATPTATGTAATSEILPSLDDLFLTEEEKELIGDQTIPWLSDNDFTLSDDGTFYSDSIIPPRSATMAYQTRGKTSSSTTIRSSIRCHTTPGGHRQQNCGRSP